jgi:hypothetical protein
MLIIHHETPSGYDCMDAGAIAERSVTRHLPLRYVGLRYANPTYMTKSTQ